MQWYARAEMSGSPSNEQIELITEDDIVAAHVDSDAERVEITLTGQAPRFERAVVIATAAFKRLANTQDLISEEVLSEPYRLTVETSDARQQGLPILSTAGAAKRLGFSEARVRDLKKTDPTFPQPIGIPGAAGDFYRTAEIDAWKATRRPGTPDAGRPRATDEPHLRAALRAVLKYASVDAEVRSQIEAALRVEGGRYVRGKALLLARLPRARLAEVEGTLAGDAKDLFVSTVGRAREIVGD